MRGHLQSLLYLFQSLKIFLFESIDWGDWFTLICFVSWVWWYGEWRWWQVWWWCLAGDNATAEGSSGIWSEESINEYKDGWGDHVGRRVSTMWRLTKHSAIIRILCLSMQYKILKTTSIILIDVMFFLWLHPKPSVHVTWSQATGNDVLLHTNQCLLLWND